MESNNYFKTVVHIMGYDSKKFGGLERYIINLAVAAKEKGIKIIPVYNRVPKSEQFIKALKDNNIEFLVANAMNAVSFYKSFSKIVKQYKPVIVHSHFQPFFPAFYGYLLGIKHRWNTVRLMLVDKDHKEVSYKHELKGSSNFYRSIINRFTTRFFAVSGAVNKQYKNIYPGHAHKFEILHNGSVVNNNDRESGRQMLSLEPRVVYIGCIAFASKIKGVDVLFDAIHILSTRNLQTQFKLCMIGLDNKNEYTSYLLNKIEEHQINSLIMNFGIINNVPQVLPAMDIYVQPSRSENLSNAILEAGFAGVPTIGSRVGGTPELIVDGETGYLFESENSDELADKLQLLIENEVLRKEMGKKSRQHKLDNFLMEDKIARLISYYESAV